MKTALTPYHLAALNNAWANATFYAALADMDAATFAAPRPGFFASLKATMNHIYEVDLYYVDALETGGLGRSVYDRTDIDTPQALAPLQAAVDARLVAFCAALTEGTLCEKRQTERKGHMTHETVGDLVPHLIQHQVHHRGQAHVQLHHAGIAPPQLDDFYLQHGRVATAAALRSSASQD